MSDLADLQPLRFDNPKIQRLRRLIGRRSARLEQGAFVVEGPTLSGEAIAAGWTIDSLYVPHDDPDCLNATQALVASSGVATPVFELARGVLERVASTETPQAPLAVVAMPPTAPVESVLGDAAFVVVADGLSDPGNLGTILRSAEAAGVDAVVVTPGTVDAFNPKVIRASAGALFHVPLVAAQLDDVRAAGLRVVGTSSHRGGPHFQADWTGRVAIAAGNEAHGLADDAAVDDWVRIEHRGRSESLNVAMATTVLCIHAMTTR